MFESFRLEFRLEYFRLEQAYMEVDKAIGGRFEEIGLITGFVAFLQ